MKSFTFTSANGVYPDGRDVATMREPLTDSFIRHFTHPMTKNPAYHGKILAHDLEEAQEKYKDIIPHSTHKN